MSTTIAAASTPRPHSRRSYVSGSHKVHQDRLRRRAGAAYLRLPGQVDALAREIGLHHTSMVHRRQGQGPLARVLLEVDAWERAGIDTTPLLEAVLDVQLAARGSDAADARTLAPAEQAADGAEDEAEVAYLSGLPGAARRWRDGLVALLPHQMRLIRALDQEIAE